MLGPSHSVTQFVERDLRNSGNYVTDAHLEKLDDKARQAIDFYYETLRERLPQEARAAQRKIAKASTLNLTAETGLKKA